MRLSRLFIFLLLLPAFTGLQAMDPPRIIVTIKPVHSVVSALLKDVSEVDLLLGGSRSPHTYSLKPSDAHKLSRADLVIWIGPTLEGYLRKAIESQLSRARIISLAEQIDDTDQVASHHEDPHLWLDPVQMASLLPFLATEMEQLFPGQNDTIQRNLEALTNRLQALHRQIQSELPSGKSLSAIAYHDAWHYFKQRYGLETGGVVSAHEQQQPSANHLHQLQLQIRNKNIQCLLVEPQYNPKYLNALTRNLPIRLVQADPLGNDIQPGPDAYFTIMQNISRAFAQCLYD